MFPLINDKFQNYKNYNLPKAQLILTDVPYEISTDFYASRPDWYLNRKIENGHSDKANTPAFASDSEVFNFGDFFSFCAASLKNEPAAGESGAPCIVLFCAFQQMPTAIQEAEKQGFKKNEPLVFCKNYSPQVLKANMKIVGATEYGLVFYRNKLPKFNNDGHMIFNWFEWKRDGKDVQRIHPTQKPMSVLKRIIEIYTDKGDVVIDPCAGSGSTLRAAKELGRQGYGFEVDKEFFKKAEEALW